VKLYSSSTLHLSKKISSHERALDLSQVFDNDKYEALSFQIATVSLNGVCAIDLMKSMLNTVHKLSEDVAVLKSNNISLKSQINKLHKKVCQPQGSLSSRVGLQADKKIADPSKAAPRRNPSRNYAAVAILESAYCFTFERIC
jgi:hypothetical protein